MSERQPDKVLDLRGWSCPWCILKAKSWLERMTPGQILEVHCTDPSVRKNHAYPVDAEGRFGGMVLWAADIPDDPVRYKNSSLMRQLAPNISRVSNG